MFSSLKPMRRMLAQAGLALAVVALAAPAPAQIQAVDPDKAIDGDLMPPAQQAQTAPAPPIDIAPAPVDAPPVVTSSDPAVAAGQAASDPAVAAAQGDTYRQDDLIGAAEGV